MVFIPTLSGIRRLFPDAKITLLTNAIGKELSTIFSLADETIQIELSEYRKLIYKPLHFMRFVRQLSRYDLSIASHDECSMSYFVAKYLDIPRRFGFANNAKSNFLLTDSLENDFNLPAVMNDFRLIHLLSHKLYLNNHCLDLDSIDTTYIKEQHIGKTTKPTSNKKYIIIHPHSRLAYKTWSMERFTDLSKQIASKYNYLDVILINKQPCTAKPKHNNIYTYPEHSIGGFISLLKDSTLFIGNNSGPMHLAGFLGVPVISICGPSPKHWHLYWNEKGLNRNIVANLDCVPCEKEFFIPGECKRKSEKGLCMKMISVEQVMSAVDEILSSIPGKN